MARESERIPSSRVRRTATVGTLAASEAMKQFGTRAANVTRSQAGAEEAMARRQLETAKQIVTVLGTMKGAAMKLGQVMSFLDVGLVPEQHREEFQHELAKLRDAAPTVSFKQMQRVIEDDLEEPIDDVFASFYEQPIAAASIGQVYRATLHDGREVAVKVQYPGVAGAVRADLQNLEMIMRLLKRMTPGMDVKAIAEEIRERIAEELDYELEAQNQRSLARIFTGHPFIFVPDVVGELSRERVLVSEFVQGTGFEELKGYSQAVRDRMGEIVFRFFVGCLYRHRQFSGDPHPGNFLLLADVSRSWTSGCSSAWSRRRWSWSSHVSGRSWRAMRRRCTGCSRPQGSCPSPTAWTPISCWRSSRTRSGGTRPPMNRSRSRRRSRPTS